MAAECHSRYALPISSENGWWEIAHAKTRRRKVPDIFTLIFEFFSRLCSFA
jgi:hypothetical protein